MAINAGTIMAYLDLDTSKFGSAMQLAQSQMSSFAQQGGGLSGTINAMGAGMTTMGRALTVGVATPLMGAGIASLKLAGNFQATGNMVATIADTSVVSMKDLGSGILAMSNETGIAATDLNAALYQTISATGDTANALAYTEIAAKAAKGGFTDTSTAIDGLTTVMNAYGLQGEAAMQAVSDQMLMAQNYGKTTFGELASSIGKVIPLTAQLGVGTDELFASIAALTKQGIGTAEATTGLKAAFSNIIKPSKEAADAAAALGLDFSSAALQSKGLSGFLQDVIDKTGGNTDTMAQLFGSVEALNTIMALCSEQGMKDFQGGLDAMADSSGATESAYQTMMGGLNAGLTRLKTSFGNLGISLGQIILPYAEKLVGWAQKGVDWLNGLSDGSKRFAVVGAAIVAAIGPILTIGGKLLTNFGGVNPLILAAGGAIALVYKHSERLQGVVGTLKENATALFVKLKGGMTSYQEELTKGATRTDALRKALTGAFGQETAAKFSTFIDKAAQLGTNLKSTFSAATEGIGAFVGSLIDGKGAAAALNDGLQAAFGDHVPIKITALRTSLTGLIGELKADYANGGLLGAAQGLGQKLVAALKSGFSSAKERVIEAAQSLMTNLGDWLRSPGVQGKLGDLKGIAGTILQKISAGKTLLVSKAGELLRNLGAALSSDAAKSKIGNLAGIASKIAEKIASGMGSWKITAMNLIGNLVGQLTDSGFLAEAVTGLESIVTAIVNGLGTAATGMADAASSLLTQLINGLTQSGKVEGLFTGAASVVESIANTLISAATQITPVALSLIETLLEAITAIDWNTIFTTAGTVVIGIANQIAAAAPKIIGCAGTLITSLIDKLSEDNFISNLFTNAASVVLAIGSCLAANAGSILGCATTLVTTLCNKLSEDDFISGLFTTAATVVAQIGNTLAANADQIVTAAGTLALTLLSGLASVDWATVSTSLGTALQKLIISIANWFATPGNLEQLAACGYKIADGILNGISDGKVRVSEITSQMVDAAFDRTPLARARASTNGKYIAESWTDSWYSTLERGLQDGSLTSEQQIAMAVSLIGQGFGDKIKALSPSLYDAANGTFNSVYNAVNDGNIIGNFSNMGYRITDELALAISTNQITVEDAARALSLGMTDEAILGMSQSDLRTYMNGYFAATATDVENLLTQSATDWGKIFGRAIPDGATVGLENGMYTLRSKTGDVIALVSAVDAESAVKTGNKDTAEAGMDAMSGGIDGKKGEVEVSAQNAADSAVQPFEGLPAETQAQAELMMQCVNVAIQNGSPQATAAIQTAAQAVVSEAAALLNSDTGSGLGAAFTGGIATGIQLKRILAVTQAQNVANSAYNTAAGILNTTNGRSLGINLVQGVINGVNIMAYTLRLAMISLANGAISAYRGALDMHSPSRVLVADGALMVQSIINGVYSRQSDAQRSMIELAHAMSDTWTPDGPDTSDAPRPGGGNTPAPVMVNVTGNEFHVRDDSDVDAIGRAIGDEVRLALRGD